MAKSFKTGRVLSMDHIRRIIEDHLPRKEDFSFQELNVFLRELGIEAISTEIGSAIQTIIKKHDDPADNLNKPVLHVRDGEFVFRLGHL